jgi:hypothetical protein
MNSPSANRLLTPHKGEIGSFSITIWNVVTIAAL